MKVETTQQVLAAALRGLVKAVEEGAETADQRRAMRAALKEARICLALHDAEEAINQHHESKGKKRKV